MVWYGMVSYGMGVDFLFFFWGGRGRGFLHLMDRQVFLFQMGYPAFGHFESDHGKRGVCDRRCHLGHTRKSVWCGFWDKKPSYRLQGGYRWVTAWYFVFCSR